jgi:hypothetical protein
MNKSPRPVNMPPRMPAEVEEKFVHLRRTSTFVGVDKVLFTGRPATFRVYGEGTRIRAVVPVGARSGWITVVNPAVREDGDVLHRPEGLPAWYLVLRPARDRFDHRVSAHDDGVRLPPLHVALHRERAGLQANLENPALRCLLEGRGQDPRAHLAAQPHAFVCDLGRDDYRRHATTFRRR